jgi:histidinol-phosphate aminotransferase
MGGIAAALGAASLNPFELAAQRGQRGQRPGGAAAGAAPPAPKDQATLQAEYDKQAKLANNENPYGPSEAVLKAMNDAWKYANRYGYPDGGIRQAIAEHHGVKPENVIISAGSGEILKLVDDAYLIDHKKVVGPDPTYGSVYQYTTNSKAVAIRVPLRKDYTTDIDAIIHATKMHSRDVGLVYLCNPNNPTGNIIHKDEVKKLLTNIPEEIPVLIDEAYHHFVDNPNYEPSIKYVLEGRRVIVARTFSKIAALAGMRLGFAIAPPDMVQEMQPFALSSISSIVKYGGVAALKDAAYEQKMKSLNKQLRDRTTSELNALGWETIPSDANFFMVHIKTDMGPIQTEFQKKGVLVGRRFSPMDEWLRVSVGSDDEMKRFMAAFKEIFPNPPKTSAAAGA